MKSPLEENAQQILLQVKLQKPVDTLRQQIASATPSQLLEELKGDALKKAFWINIYNAYFLILRKQEGLEKPQIYRDKAIRIAGHQFSLDDIEHGILRKYRYKFSLGYLPNIFTPRLIKDLAVQQIDYRIHFALNCGAKSCPPIAFYHPDRLDQQLEMATLSYLEGDTEVKEAEKEIHISRLFQWFLGDFGGNSGIRTILKKVLKIESAGYKLVYKKYDWDEELDNFV